MGHDLEPGMRCSEVGEHPWRGVARAIVDDHHLERQAGPGQRLATQADELGQVVRFVLGRDQHGQPRGSAHTRLRIRAGRMPSWSRYLATVRRAIWMPCSSNRWTICWSVSGFAGFSSATIFSSLARIERADASSPVAVESALEKKNLSGSTPRGVWTYFSLVTRDTVDSCIEITSATSRSVSGLRYSIPFSKKSRWRSTMKFITLSIVCRRCSIAWIIQVALFIREAMKSRFSAVILERSR